MPQPLPSSHFNICYQIRSVLQFPRLFSSHLAQSWALESNKTGWHSLNRVQKNAGNTFYNEPLPSGNKTDNRGHKYQSPLTESRLIYNQLSQIVFGRGMLRLEASKPDKPSSRQRCHAKSWLPLGYSYNCWKMSHNKNRINAFYCHWPLNQRHYIPAYDVIHSSRSGLLLSSLRFQIWSRSNFKIWKRLGENESINCAGN